MIALAVGIYLVLAGVMKLVSAFETSVGRGWLLFGGVLDLAIGVVIVAWPQFGLTSLAVILGIALDAARDSRVRIGLRAAIRGQGPARRS